MQHFLASLVFADGISATITSYASYNSAQQTTITQKQRRVLALLLGLGPEHLHQFGQLQCEFEPHLHNDVPDR